MGRIYAKHGKFHSACCVREGEREEGEDSIEYCRGVLIAENERNRLSFHVQTNVRTAHSFTNDYAF